MTKAYSDMLRIFELGFGVIDGFYLYICLVYSQTIVDRPFFGRKTFFYHYLGVNSNMDNIYISF